MTRSDESQRPPTDVPAGERFVFIDALRGVAALAVVCHHAFIASALQPVLTATLPRWASAVLEEHAARGVQVFFVISGFVIAHSLRNVPMTARECGRFVVRRQLRLDPPYWAALGISLALAAVHRFSAGVHPRLPLDGVTTLANFAYVDHVFNLPAVLNVGWTLGVEIQFYVAFMLVLVAGRLLGSRRATEVILLVTAVGLVATNPNVTFEERWAGHAWPYFAAGVFCYWSLRSAAPAGYGVAVVAALLGSAVAFGLHSPVVVGVGTVVAVYAVGRAGRLTTLGGGPVVQSLGRISYSLYLTHIAVLTPVQTRMFNLTRDNRAAAVGWYLASVLIAIAVAYPFHLLVERPSVRLSHLLRNRRRPPATTDVVTGGVVPAEAQPA